MYCALNRENDGISCFTVDELIEIATNLTKEGKKIHFDKNLEMLHPHKYKKYLIEEISKILGNTQEKWIKYVGKKIEEIFPPKGPEGKYEWLNSIQIEQFLEQLEKKYPNFMSLGAVPIDFWEINYDGIRDKLKDLNELVKKGKTRLGIVYNLDTHNQPGSHWVASFVDLENGLITYFDSYGIKPNKRVRKFLRMFAKFMKKNNIKIHSEYNSTRNQYKNSECGMYSINFIKMLCENIEFNKIEKTPIPDDIINGLRKKFFTLHS